MTLLRSDLFWEVKKLDILNSISTALYNFTFGCWIKSLWMEPDALSNELCSLRHWPTFSQSGAQKWSSHTLGRFNYATDSTNTVWMCSGASHLRTSFRNTTLESIICPSVTNTSGNNDYVIVTIFRVIAFHLGMLRSLKEWIEFPQSAHIWYAGTRQWKGSEMILLNLDQRKRKSKQSCFLSMAVGCHSNNCTLILASSYPSYVPIGIKRYFFFTCNFSKCKLAVTVRQQLSWSLTGLSRTAHCYSEKEVS